jgi:hypothetical protein
MNKTKKQNKKVTKVKPKKEIVKKSKVAKKEIKRKLLGSIVVDVYDKDILEVRFSSTASFKQEKIPSYLITSGIGMFNKIKKKK